MKFINIVTLAIVFLLLTSCLPEENVYSTETLIQNSIYSALLDTPTTTTTPTLSPTPTPALEEISFYELLIEYVCSSNFCSIEFLNPEVILAISEVTYEDDVRVSFDYPFINIDRHGEILQDKVELLEFTISISIDNINNNLKIQSRHGYTGGSSLRFSLVDNENSFQIREFNHFYKNPSNPDENPEIFTFALETLDNYSPQNKKILNSPNDKMVWAVYYPWIAWNQDLVCTDHPLIDYQYNDDGSRTEETYKQEVEIAKSAGIDGFFVSWFNDPVSNHDLQLLLDVAEKLDFKIAIYLESLLGGSVNPEIEDWIRFAIVTFGNHPAYMKVNGKPVLMLYGYLDAPYASWKSLFEDLQIHGYEAVYFPASYNLFDLQISTGLHQYINLDKRDLGSLYSTLSRSVHMLSGNIERKFFVATVSPGFNNCPYGIDDPPYEIPRESGSFYENQFTSAINSNPDWIMITSWNEFGESTHIQPSEKYGNYYVELTQDFVKKWKYP